METRAQIIDHGFVDLINRHRRMLEKVCRIYEDAAEDRRDLFQEIVYQRWRSYPSFRGEAKVTTWVYRVALNTAITAFRQQKSRPEHVDLVETPASAPQRNAKTESVQQEKIELLYRAIRELNKIDRAVVAMYLEGFEYKEIADALGLTETNVGVKLNRIKSRLQEFVRGQQ